MEHVDRDITFVLLSGHAIERPQPGGAGIAIVADLRQKPGEGSLARGGAALAPFTEQLGGAAVVARCQCEVRHCAEIVKVGVLPTV